MKFQDISLNLKIDTENKPKLAKVLDRINKDVEIATYITCANINATNRLAMNDHGKGHIRIVASNAITLLRLLSASSIKTNMESDFNMNFEDAEVVVLLAIILHDIGISIHRDQHVTFSLFLVNPILERLLKDIYVDEDFFVMKTQIMSAISSEEKEYKALTIEASVVKVADATDISYGRARVALESGHADIHSISSASIKNVKVLKGKTKPVMIEATLISSAGVFQLDKLLKEKVNSSLIKEYLEFSIKIEHQSQNILERYNFKL